MDFLQPTNRTYLESSNVKAFNDYYGSTTQSEKHIASPATWSILSYYQNFEKDDFLKVCTFKWCFNAKPDIVIHTSVDAAICIEAKLESGEGSYPSKKRKSIFSTPKD